MRDCKRLKSEYEKNQTNFIIQIDRLNRSLAVQEPLRKEYRTKFESAKSRFKTDSQEREELESYLQLEKAKFAKVEKMMGEVHDMIIKSKLIMYDIKQGPKHSKDVKTSFEELTRHLQAFSKECQHQGFKTAFTLLHKMLVQIPSATNEQLNKVLNVLLSLESSIQDQQRRESTQFTSINAKTQAKIDRKTISVARLGEQVQKTRKRLRAQAKKVSSLVDRFRVAKLNKRTMDSLLGQIRLDC